MPPLSSDSPNSSLQERLWQTKQRSNRVGSHIRKHVMDSHAHSTNPECDPSLFNSYSLQRLRNISYPNIRNRLHWIRSGSVSARERLCHSVRKHSNPIRRDRIGPDNPGGPKTSDRRDPEPDL